MSVEKITIRYHKENDKIMGLNQDLIVDTTMTVKDLRKLIEGKVGYPVHLFENAFMSGGVIPLYDDKTVGYVRNKNDSVKEDIIDNGEHTLQQAFGLMPRLHSDKPHQIELFTQRKLPSEKIDDLKIQLLNPLINVSCKPNSELQFRITVDKDMTIKELKDEIQKLTGYPVELSIYSRPVTEENMTVKQFLIDHKITDGKGNVPRIIDVDLLKLPTAEENKKLEDDEVVKKLNQLAEDFKDLMVSEKLYLEKASSDAKKQLSPFAKQLYNDPTFSVLVTKMLNGNSSSKTSLSSALVDSNGAPVSITSFPQTMPYCNGNNASSASSNNNDKNNDSYTDNSSYTCPTNFSSS